MKTLTKQALNQARHLSDSCFLISYLFKPMKMNQLAYYYFSHFSFQKKKSFKGNWQVYNLSLEFIYFKDTCPIRLYIFLQKNFNVYLSLCLQTINT